MNLEHSAFRFTVLFKIFFRANKFHLLSNESGYLYEIPLVVLLSLLIWLLFGRLLPAPWNFIPALVPIVAFIVFLVYFFIVGWLENTGKRK